MFRENGKMICAGCFTETSDENICYSCGRNLSESSHEIALKKGTVLKDRYVIGKLNTFDDLVNRYTAYDKVEGKIVLVTEYMPKILASRTDSTAELNIASENNYPNYNNGLQTFSSAASYFKETTQKGMQKCFDVFYENFTAYAVFEKIEGQSLGVMMKNFNNDSSLVVNLLKPLLVGLEDLHRQGYNFGQISPMKIIFRNGKADDPVLCDADLYSHVDLNMDTYCFTGKLSAFSPIEAYMSRHVKSNSNDIYSLCLSLYSCFDERIAANIEENKTIDKNIVKAKGFSNKMADIFAKACSANFEDRYLNAFEIMCDIGLRKREPQQGAKNNKKSKKVKTIALVCTGFFTVILILLIIFCIRFCGNSSTGAGASGGNEKEDADITEESANDSEGSSTNDVSEDGESGEVSENEKIPTSGSILDDYFQTDDTTNIDDEAITEDDTSSKGEGDPEQDKGNTEGGEGNTEGGEGNTEGDEGNTEGGEGNTEGGEGNTEGGEGNTEGGEGNTEGGEGNTEGGEGNTEGGEGNTEGGEGNTEGGEGNTEGGEGNTEGGEGNTEGGEGNTDGGEGSTEGGEGNTEGGEGNTEGGEGNTEGGEGNTEGGEGNTEGGEGNTEGGEGNTDGGEGNTEGGEGNTEDGENNPGQNEGDVKTATEAEG